MKTLSTLDTDLLQEISELPTETALPQAASFLARLVNDPDFVEGEILSVLEEARGREEWYISRQYEGEDSSFSLKVFVWPPGTETKVHDHSSWGAYICAWDTILEERYERLDDGSRFEHARLQKVWQLSWSPEDGASTVLPGDGGIHSVGNQGDEVAVSIHLYGPRIGEVDGRDYDPSREYVCDRTED